MHLVSNLYASLISFFFIFCAFLFYLCLASWRHLNNGVHTEISSFLLCKLLFLSDILFLFHITWSHSTLPSVGECMVPLHSNWVMHQMVLWWCILDISRQLSLPEIAEKSFFLIEWEYGMSSPMAKPQSLMTVYDKRI